MKLIIQIPCYNEEESLPITLSQLPRKIEGIDVIELLIINDGSTDNTVKVAKENGVDHIVNFPRNKGLARAFIAGIEECIKQDADIIVNTDADNQYNAEDIPKLIQPILCHNADMVVGTRPISKTQHFSFIKKLLQKLGSFVVRVLSKTNVEDAPCGFRAISRNFAKQINVFNEFTYTMETIIQAGQKSFHVVSVPIRTNKQLRKSRLFKGVFSYLRQSAIVIIRIFITYKPLKFFLYSGILSFSFGFIIGLRFLYNYLYMSGGGQIQSLILAALLLGSGLFLSIIGLVADLISVNRKLLEKLNSKMYDLEDRMKELNK